MAARRLERMLPALATVFKAQRDYTDAVERRTGSVRTGCSTGKAAREVDPSGVVDALQESKARRLDPARL